MLTRRSFMKWGAAFASMSYLPFLSTKPPVTTTPAPAKPTYKGSDTPFIAPDVVPFKTGFPALDKILNGGIWPGELVLVTGDHGSGKTSFLTRIAEENNIPPISCASMGGSLEGEFDHLHLCHNGVGSLVCDHNFIELFDAIKSDTLPPQAQKNIAINMYLRKQASTVGEWNKQPDLRTYNAAIVEAVPASRLNSSVTWKFMASVIIHLRRQRVGSDVLITKNRWGETGTFSIDFSAIHGAYQRHPVYKIGDIVRNQDAPGTHLVEGLV